jgi:hypothetical protein
MQRERILQSIIKLPVTFGLMADKSPFTILSDLGYAKIHDSVSEIDIYSVLTKEPNYLEDWLSFSADKRTVGWYIYRSESDFYVGRLDNTGSKADEKCYDDGLKACAAFIKHEIDDILNMQ